MAGSGVEAHARLAVGVSGVAEDQVELRASQFQAIGGVGIQGILRDRVFRRVSEIDRGSGTYARGVQIPRHGVVVDWNFHFR